MAAVKLVLGLMMMASVMAGPSVKKDLSSEEHYHDGVHNSEYDHEAFLGKEQVMSFHELPPAEAMRRLGIIVDRIDLDSDGKATQQELHRWISHVTKRYVYDDVDRTWSFHDTDDDGFVNWDEYKDVYSTVKDPDTLYDRYRGITYRQKLERDEIKFKAADKNHDGKLNKDEYGSFLHPEADPAMRDVYINENFVNMDDNKDGYVSIEEYTNDRLPQSEKSSSEPDWMQSEKEQFLSHRDKDKDGRLNREELGDWLSPTDYDPIQSEARHLIHHADVDKDGSLSKSEILNKFDLFVGSRATEWGKFMTRHDEF